MEQFEIGPRIKAARHLAGFDGVQNLAAAIKAAGNSRGLGTTKLRQMERGKQSATAGELGEIAHACGLPLSWFTADFGRLDEISGDPRQLIAQQLALAGERSASRRGGTTEVPPTLREADQ